MGWAEERRANKRIRKACRLVIDWLLCAKGNVEEFERLSSSSSAHSLIISLCDRLSSLFVFAWVESSDEEAFRRLSRMFTSLVVGASFIDRASLGEYAGDLRDSGHHNLADAILWISLNYELLTSDDERIDLDVV